METILRNDCQNEEGVARKMFLLHVSKDYADADIVAGFIVKAAEMSVVREIDEYFSRIRTSAMKVFGNSQVKILNKSNVCASHSKNKFFTGK